MALQVSWLLRFAAARPGPRQLGPYFLAWQGGSCSHGRTKMQGTLSMPACAKAGGYFGHGYGRRDSISPRRQWTFPIARCRTIVLTLSCSTAERSDKGEASYYVLGWRCCLSQGACSRGCSLAVVHNVCPPSPQPGNLGAQHFVLPNLDSQVGDARRHFRRGSVNHGHRNQSARRGSSRHCVAAILHLRRSC